MLLSAAWLSTTTSQIDSDMNSAPHSKCTPHCRMSIVMIIFDFACLWFTSLVGYLRWRQYSLQGTIRSCDAWVFLALESHFFLCCPKSLCVLSMCKHAHVHVGLRERDVCGSYNTASFVVSQLSSLLCLFLFETSPDSLIRISPSGLGWLVSNPQESIRTHHCTQHFDMGSRDEIQVLTLTWQALHWWANSSIPYVSSFPKHSFCMQGQHQFSG